MTFNWIKVLLWKLSQYKILEEPKKRDFLISQSYVFPFRIQTYSISIYFKKFDFSYRSATFNLRNDWLPLLNGKQR